MAKYNIDMPGAAAFCFREGIRPPFHNDCVAAVKLTIIIDRVHKELLVFSFIAIYLLYINSVI